MRLLLADDDRQRYSAWYKDYAISAQPPLDGASAAEAQALQLQQQQQPAITRSQQLIAASAGQQQYLANSLLPIVDLQIALITPLPIVAKPMQVRLTRTRHQCSDLRAFMGQSPFMAASPMSPIPSYASSATASSSAAPTLLGAANSNSNYYYSISSMLILIVTLLLPLCYCESSSSLYAYSPRE